MTDISGYSMLDLFRMEVEAQAAILNENLLALENQPSSAKELEALMRAAHSIKGAARIVEIDAAVNLAHIMEDCFVAAQSQRITLTPDDIDVLLRGVDMLANISRVENGGLEGFLEENESEIAATRAEIAAILTPGAENKGRTGERESQKSKVKSQNSSSSLSPPPSPSPSSSTPSPSSPTPPPPVSPTLPEPPEAPAAPEMEEVPSIGNSSMLELFRLEVDAQTKILNDGLLALESQPDSLRELEALMRAAHSIKGAARIVAIDAAVNLAHVMEDCFVEAQKQTITLAADSIDILLRGVDLIQNISQLEPAELGVWLKENRQEIETTRQEISAILTPGSAPVPRKKAEPANGQSDAVKPKAQEQTASIDAKTETQIDSSAQPEQQTQSAALVPQSASAKETSVTKQIVKNPPTPIGPAKESKAAPIPTKDTNKDRVVMVSAENLNRIMGLAGETLIEASWLQPYADSLMMLKKRQQELSKVLENLQEACGKSHVDGQTENILKVARDKERECREILLERIHTLELYAGRTANLSDRLYREVIASHMRPFADGVQSFPRMMRDLARKLGKQVNFEIVGKATPVDRDILKKLEAPLTHILRNALDHGLEMPDDRIAVGKPTEGTIKLEATHRSGMLAVTISDDGKGMNLEQLREKIVRKKLASPEMAAKFTESELLEFIFLPGFSTAAQVTEISGRGVGLDIAKSMAHEVGGTVRASSVPGKGMSFHFQLPLTLSVIRTLLVEISGEPYAFPLARIEQLVMLDKSEIAVAENRQYFTLNGENIGLIAAYQVLELPPSSFKSDALPVVVIGDQSNRFGMVVDKFLGERDLVVRPLDPRLGKVQDIGAAALMGDGSPILIVDVIDLVRSIDNLLNTKDKELQQVSDDDGDGKLLETKKRILVVDDSITVREMERKLLENKGYMVEVAVDGMDGWNAVRTNHYDLVVSDIDMPRMNGIEFVSQIKNHPKLNSIPVIIVSYRDKEEHRIQGLEAGADYYLTKSSFQDDSFFKAVIDLIGEP
ncbi:response regulator [Aerosakkonema sp. BLCC-F183]|uniref:response regulator n=1 Tax=Aerosakkonema sp. BLCC-F183 TaxID=3342834 RepID=UPI0035B718FB